MAGAQTAPNLTRQQRDHLQSLVTAADAAAATPSSTVADARWFTHRMRASDGSHYVAVQVEPPQSALGDVPVMIYVRLATRTEPGTTTVAERSAVREWLAGARTDPRLLPRRNIAIGDMPAFGAGGVAARGSTPTSGTTDLRLMALERERAKQEQEDRDKQRKAELEGRQAATRTLLPFEDFDLATRPQVVDGARLLSRAFTAGPGNYELYLAWIDASAPRGATPRVSHLSVTLPVARTAGLSTSDVILADAVSARAAPYPPSEQASHPYSIGPMEVSPNRTHRFNREGDLALVLQVINAQSTEAGMPDVAVNIRIMKMVGDRETPAASLNPHLYNETTLAPDFNLRAGHPLFAAVTAPLSSLSRGDYRAKITVTDRIAGVSTGTEADFSIAATPSSLLADAPPLPRAFRRDVALSPSAIEALLTALAPGAPPSPALGRALATARSGKLVDLLVEEPVSPSESGIRSALSGLAYLSVGDASASVLLQQALEQHAPAGPVQFLLGCARAAQGRDADAIAAWRTSIASGSAPAVTALLLAEALFRQRNAAEASGMIPPDAAASSPDWIRLDAAIKISLRRDSEAAAALATYLLSHADDQDARWLFLHARYAQYVRDRATLTPADRDTFRTQAQAYLDANAPHSALLRDWLTNF